MSITFEKEILWFVVPVVFMCWCVLYVLFAEYWSKVDINGKKY